MLKFEVVREQQSELPWEIHMNEIGLQIPCNDLTLQDWKQIHHHLYAEVLRNQYIDYKNLDLTYEIGSFACGPVYEKFHAQSLLAD